MDIKEMMKSLVKSKLFGNDRYGNSFDDSEQCCARSFPFPVRIIVRKGAIIDNLTFVFNEMTMAHGGNGGTQQEFSLQSDEHIVKVVGNTARFSNDVVIENISFTTDKGRTFSAGQPKRGDGYFECVAQDGYAVCTMHGWASNYLGAIGFYTRKIELDFNAQSPFGKMPGLK